MDFSFVVRRRLEELGLDQRDLANRAEVTESYISQLLGRKKLPPLPNRTDLYDKMSRVLGLTRDELARLAAIEHHEALDQKWLDAPPPRFGPMRELTHEMAARLTQMRELSRTFTAHMAADGDWELRLLPTPLYRYPTAKAGVVDGALFALMSSFVLVSSAPVRPRPHAPRPQQIIDPAHDWQP